MFKTYRLRDFDFKLVFFILAVSIIGILVIGSAQESVQDKQIMGLFAGVVVLLVLSLIDYSFILNFYWLIYVGNIGMLFLVRFFGDDAGGAARWIDIAGFRFQPSELSKILLILFFARYFMVYQEKLNTLRQLLITAVLIMIPWILIKEQPDLSTSIVVALIFLSMLYIAGLSYKFILIALGITVPTMAIFIGIIMQPGQTLLDPYQLKRILGWLQPSKYADIAYQQMNSVMAIGSGQLYGKGLNNNVISSVKNGNFISEPQTDFIFSVVGEELGFVGGVAVIGLLALIVLECIWIGRKAKDASGKLICCGMATLVGFQSFINIGVTTELLPNTGLPLPFVSYGLTSLMSLLIGMGVVLNVGLQQKR